jgi:hypothetical protein
LVLASCAIPFGGLQGIEFLYVVVSLHFLDMSSKVARTTDPLQPRFAVAIAIRSCRICNDPITSLALLNYRMALSSVVSATVFPHEDALRPRLDRLTNHGYHLPSEIKYKKTRLWTIYSGFSLAKGVSYTRIISLCQYLIWVRIRILALTREIKCSIFGMFLIQFYDGV